MTNEEMRASWTALGTRWVKHEAVFDAVFAPATRALLAAAGISEGDRVLDVGCGSGTLLAAAVADGAAVVGIDISATMVAAARARVPDATVLLADAQETDLVSAAPGRPFDRVISRFGVMFFADPVVAFTRIGAATGEVGRLAFACWRPREENPIFTSGSELINEALERIGALPPPAAPDAPGPTSLGDPARITSILTAAGWTPPTITAYDFEVDYGRAPGATDGVNERLDMILATPAGAHAQSALAPALGESGWADLLEESRAHLRSSTVDGSVRFPGAVWIVTATPA
ncbi:class I SAM-dependent methyltransferase [Nocardioides sp. GXZ039]|uniref:class I SAM-dependent methyltransferase n=1 Tax=Nocardioides sp. GXZ039 TaxID=3136018 RepID=UPI0030F4673E